LNPKELYYSKEHTWARLEGDKATVGITDYAQKELGDVVFVELPEVGRTVSQGEAFGTIESVKAVSDLHSPLSGEVIEVNQVLEEAPETVNEDPYGKGWIIQLKVSAVGETDNLLQVEKYEAYIAQES